MAQLLLQFERKEFSFFFIFIEITLTFRIDHILVATTKTGLNNFHSRRRKVKTNLCSITPLLIIVIVVDFIRIGNAFAVLSA